MIRKNWVVVILAISFGFITGSCTKNKRAIKVATYNIYFLDDGIAAERKQNLEAVIRSLDADIIGFQEIDAPAALENILPENYEIAMLDDPTEVQELALAVRQPLRIKSSKYVFPESDYNMAFPRSRDLLQVEVEASGRTLTFLVLHAKSRSGGRQTTDVRRQAAAELMIDYLQSTLEGKDVILMGDFNDNPDDKSLNMLETGDKNAIGGIDTVEDAFLYNTSEQLLDRDYCSYGYSYLFESVPNDTFQLRVDGSRAENNKWRGREHNYFEDVKIKAILFDQILVSMNLRPFVSRVGVFNGAAAIRGDGSRIRFTESGVQYTKRGDLASDHVPVWAILEL
ncbi:MAG: endonuclease/exonuclease/phosphatase family protein [bacterium]